MIDVFNAIFGMKYDVDDIDSYIEYLEKLLVDCCKSTDYIMYKPPCEKGLKHLKHCSVTDEGAFKKGVEEGLKEATLGSAKEEYDFTLSMPITEEQKKAIFGEDEKEELEKQDPIDLVTAIISSDWYSIDEIHYIVDLLSAYLEFKEKK